METLRILVVLPLYGGSLPIGRYVASALKGEGHLVETFEAPDFYPAYTALTDLKVTTDRLDYLQNSLLNVVSQSVLAKVEAFEPDLVLAMAQAPLKPSGPETAAPRRGDHGHVVRGGPRPLHLLEIFRAPCTTSLP